MWNQTFAGRSMWSVLWRRLAFGLTLAAAVILTMVAIGAASIAWAAPNTGPDYLSITGARVVHVPQVDTTVQHDH